MFNDNELWHTIKGFEDSYMVSTHGNVMALSREVGYTLPTGKRVSYTLPEKSLNTYDSSGYLKVDLYKNAERRKVFVHILVAEAFIMNPDHKPQVNHKDGNRGNPRVDNLEWTTQKENVHHAIEVLGRTFNSHPPKGAHSKFSIPITQYALSGTFIRQWGSLAEIKRELGYNASHISDCCKGKLKTMYGYCWKYKNAI